MYIIRPKPLSLKSQGLDSHSGPKRTPWPQFFPLHIHHRTSGMMFFHLLDSYSFNYELFGNKVGELTHDSWKVFPSRTHPEGVFLQKNYKFSLQCPTSTLPTFPNTPSLLLSHPHRSLDPPGPTAAPTRILPPGAQTPNRFTTKWTQLVFQEECIWQTQGR